MTKPLLEGRTGIIFGVANKRSIAWAIAQTLSREGMRLAFTYQGERLKEIGTQARGQINRLLGTPVHLSLHVKVLKEWQRDAKYLNRLGF